MAQVHNQFSGEYMVQDSDHMSGIPLVGAKANRGTTRQVEQSNSDDRHQGGDQHGSRQQGGERTGKNRRALINKSKRSV